MNIDRKALWAVRECGLPAVVKPCVDCSGARHYPSGKFRVNANGKLLDVWLLLCCVSCGRTSKVPVHERVNVRSLERARRLAYETNDQAVVRELTMSASLAAKNRYRLDWTGTWELETDTPFYSPDDPAPLTVLISFELPAPVRVERLLMLGLGLSRAEVRRMVADGRIRLPLALDAKAHQDFELAIAGERPPRPPPGARSPHPGSRMPGPLQEPGTVSSPPERIIPQPGTARQVSRCGGRARCTPPRGRRQPLGRSLARTTGAASIGWPAGTTPAHGIGCRLGRRTPGAGSLRSAVPRRGRPRRRVIRGHR
jgi:hypothetical protein